MDESLFFPLRLSVQVALWATFFVVIFGTITAYLLAMKKFAGKELVDMALMLPLVLPPTVVGYYLVILLGRNGFVGRYLHEWTGFSVMFTWYAAVIASFVVSLPLMIRTARAAIESVDANLINTSYTLGHSEMETAVRVVLPLARRGIIAGGVLAFARALGEFGATLMLAGNIPGRTSTMPLAIYAYASTGEWGRANWMVIFFTLISGGLLYAAGRLGRGGTPA